MILLYQSLFSPLAKKLYKLIVNLLFSFWLRTLGNPSSTCDSIYCIQILIQTICMFQEHLADLTIYNVKSPVQGTTVEFSSQV